MVIEVIELIMVIKVIKVIVVIRSITCRSVTSLGPLIIRPLLGKVHNTLLLLQFNHFFLIGLHSSASH